jgi:hypothetical protein
MAGSYAARDETLAELLDEDARSGPSLPIVLLSAAFGVAAAVITFYVAYTVAILRLEVAVALAVLMLCFAVGGTGALLSAATGSRATLPTIGLSCAVIVVIFLMFGLCMVVGALAATLLIAVGA